MLLHISTNKIANLFTIVHWKPSPKTLLHSLVTLLLDGHTRASFGLFVFFIFLIWFPILYIRVTSLGICLSLSKLFYLAWLFPVPPCCCKIQGFILTNEAYFNCVMIEPIFFIHVSVTGYLVLGIWVVSKPWIIQWT